MSGPVGSVGAVATRSPRAGGTKERILAVAQDAFAELGINGASLRRISELSGSRNVMAAQYHFGSRDALVAAIIDVNRQRLEAVRAAACGDDVTALRGLAIRELFGLVIRPFMGGAEDGDGSRDGDGAAGRSFVRFLRALVQHSPCYALWADQPATTPVTRAIYDELRRAVHTLPEPIWQMRMTVIGKMLVNAVSDHDVLGGRAVLDAGTFLADLEEMAAAALCAPVRLPVCGAAVAVAAADTNPRGD